MNNFSLSTCVLFNSAIQSINGAQFLDIACLLFQFVSLSASVFSDQVTVILPLTNIYTSL